MKTKDRQPAVNIASGDPVLMPSAKKDISCLPNPPTHQEILAKVRYAAPYQHPAGNCRHDQWVFLVKGNRVLSVSLTSLDRSLWEASALCNTCLGSGKVEMPDTCAYCGGEGCAECEGQPEVVHVPCPDKWCRAPK